MFDANAFSDEENTEPVKFERGTTQKGALCLWHRGYKFVKRKCICFSCCQKTCQATVRLDDVQHLTGRLGSNKHNHCAVFAQQSADAGRAQIKRAIEVNPQLRPSQMQHKQDGSKGQKQASRKCKPSKSAGNSTRARVQGFVGGLHVRNNESDIDPEDD
ncbi:hypothetical protein niasHT_033626 [Heterodera trifolii]|uniref:FLYWCH-type domain-containing protein n=1 Tax=Heterodera trifolii TaxID=157864 RepID=A0ABD2HW15_9BILA